jgi:tetratricopeptide (TPR) repeat protein
MSTGNTKQHTHGLETLAKLNGLLGNYSAALSYACEAQRVASISANLFREATALNNGATSLYMLGDYKKSMSFNNRARHLLGLCGLSGGQLDCVLINDQAEVHKLKSEYVEARDIQSRLLQQVPTDQDPVHHAYTLLNIAEIDVSIGASEYNVERNIEAARKHFSIMGHVNEVMMCDTILADLYLREGKVLAAESLLEKCLKSSFNVEPQVTSYCLERLGDVSRWNTSGTASSWTTVYFLHSLKFKENLGIHKALQFLGDIFHSHNNEETAVSLYTIALEGFTQMDIHRSRAECMLRLGDISKGHGDLLGALELWETARPLFERSSQAKQVEKIDGRLASVGEDVLEQHRKNLASLAELSAPLGIVEELEDEVSDIEELEVDLNEAKGIQLVAV